MAGKIIADIIEAPYDSIRMNVANVTVLTANANGLTLTGNNQISVNLINGGTISGNLKLSTITTGGVPTTGSIIIGDNAYNSNNSMKLGRIVGQQYNISNPNFLAFDVRGLDGNNEVYYGGGSGALVTVQNHVFWAAANNTTYNGNQILNINQYGIGLGTNTPSSGMGIRFPATQVPSSDVNTLDDYEEGTFTSTFGGSAGVVSGTPSLQYFKYTKIGRLVHCTGAWTYSSSGSGTVAWTFNLPFSMDSNNQQGNLGSCNPYPYASNKASGYIIDNSSADSTGVYLEASVSQAVTNGNMHFNVTYHST